MRDEKKYRQFLLEAARHLKEEDGVTLAFLKAKEADTKATKMFAQSIVLKVRAHVFKSIEFRIEKHDPLRAKYECDEAEKLLVYIAHKGAVLEQAHSDAKSWIEVAKTGWTGPEFS